jgi:putative ABC transport system permease protein
MTFTKSFLSGLFLAMGSLKAHRLRSFLTLLGVIVGVASVVLVGTAIKGVGVYAESSTAQVFGSESFLIAQIAGGRVSRAEYFEKLRRNKPIRDEETRYLQAVNGDAIMYSPYRQRTADIKRENMISEDATISGVGAEMVEIRDINVVQGRFFTEQEEKSKLPVAVIGQTIVSTLFPSGASPLGQIVRIDGIEFTVVGVLEKLGSSFGRDQDNALYVPVTIFNRMYGAAGRGFSLFGRPKATSGQTLDEALDATRLALRGKFHTPPGKEDQFDTTTPDAVRGFIDQILALVSAVVVPLTAISLVVGGIVIMNIMLVSVTERTREIGLRKSLGARQRDIMLQVLIEAILLSMAGGIIGILLAAGLVAVVTMLIGFPVSVPMGYVVVAVVVSTLVGVMSGWYPAKRAAALDPVVALRAD